MARRGRNVVRGRRGDHVPRGTFQGRNARSLAAIPGRCASATFFRPATSADVPRGTSPCLIATAAPRSGRLRRRSAATRKDGNPPPKRPRTVGFRGLVKPFAVANALRAGGPPTRSAFAGRGDPRAASGGRSGGRSAIVNCGRSPSRFQNERSSRGACPAILAPSPTRGAGPAATACELVCLGCSRSERRRSTKHAAPGGARRGG